AAYPPHQLDAVNAWEIQIDYRDVRTETAEFIDRGLAVSALRDHCELRISLQYGRQPISSERVFVGKQDRDFIGRGHQCRRRSIDSSVNQEFCALHAWFESPFRSIRIRYYSRLQRWPSTFAISPRRQPKMFHRDRRRGSPSDGGSGGSASEASGDVAATDSLVPGKGSGGVLAGSSGAGCRTTTRPSSVSSLCILCSVRSEQARNSLIAADWLETSSSSPEILWMTRVCTLSTNASSICRWLRSDSALRRVSTSDMRVETLVSSQS